jgi:hypothetical protein
MGKVVIERGSSEVRAKGMPEKPNESDKRGPVLRNDRVRDVRSRPREVPNGRKTAGTDVKPGRPNSEAPSSEGTSENFHLAVDWDNCPLGEGELFVTRLMGEVSRGRARLRDRAAAAAKSDLHCSNPDCLKPLKSEQSCVSIWNDRDVKTGIERTIYSCSERCHIINNHKSAEERVVKT